MQAIGRQPQRAPDGLPLHYERHRPEQATLYRLVQQHAADFIARTEVSCGECGRDKLLAFRCKRRGFCPSYGARHGPTGAAWRRWLGV